MVAISQPSRHGSSAPADSDTEVDEVFRELLSWAPPTDEQIWYLGVLTGGAKLTVTTFGQAQATIATLEAMRNESTLREQDWNVGDILAWNEAHWRIEEVYDESHAHRVRLSKIMCVPRRRRVRVITLTHTATRMPSILAQDGARKVTLDALVELATLSGA